MLARVPRQAVRLQGDGARARARSDMGLAEQQLAHLRGDVAARPGLRQRLQHRRSRDGLRRLHFGHDGHQRQGPGAVRPERAVRGTAVRARQGGVHTQPQMEGHGPAVQEGIQQRQGQAHRARRPRLHRHRDLAELRAAMGVEERPVDDLRGRQLRKARTQGDRGIREGTPQ